MSTRLASLVILSLVLVYGFIKAIPLIRGPLINLSELATSPDGVTTLSGTAAHTETLTLDGSTLLIDNKGHFSTNLLFPRGGVILKLTATDRFGRSRTTERMVVTP